MKLTGTAGRVLLARLNAVRLQGKDRAASNDNRPVEAARVHLNAPENSPCKRSSASERAVAAASRVGKTPK